MNESSLTRDLVKQLKTVGWFFKHHSSEMGVAGIPDVLGCIQGRFVALEVKVLRGSRLGYTRHQQIKLDEINEAGGLGLGITVDMKRPPTCRWALDTEYNGQANGLEFVSLPELVGGIAKLVSRPEP